MKASPKREKEQGLYTASRVRYLLDHPICNMAIPGICTVKSTDIQHLKGRGKYFLEEKYWMAACRSCHSYATDHPKEAIENGWALLRTTQ